MAGKIVDFLAYLRRRGDRTWGAKPYAIENGWRDHFAPIVRHAGFKGSGRHFRRVVGEFVQTINLQGSRYGGQFCVNLGLQPLAIPDVTGRSVDPEKIKEIECLFRRRLANDGDQWWRYDESKLSVENAAKSAAGLFEELGLRLFGEQVGPEAPILTVTADDFASDRHSFSGFGMSAPLVAVALMKLRLAQGQMDEARKFAKIALDRSTPNFVHRTELKKIAGSELSIQE